MHMIFYVYHTLYMVNGLSLRIYHLYLGRQSALHFVFHLPIHINTHILMAVGLPCKTRASPLGAILGSVSCQSVLKQVCCKFAQGHLRPSLLLFQTLRVIYITTYLKAATRATKSAYQKRALAQLHDTVEDQHKHSMNR